MSQRLALIAALPREITALVHGLRPDFNLLSRGIHLYTLPGGHVVATAGMGGERAALAVGAALDANSPDLLLSVGLAGACTADHPPGTATEPDLVVDPRTGERFRTDSPTPTHVTLATVATIASITEKARLTAAYNAGLVDMEAAAVARLARAHSLGFRALKGISDAHDFELASLSRFADARGHFRTGAFALHTAVRPHHWRRAVHLGRGSSRALAQLHMVLRDLLGLHNSP